ncbi:hypothetical protein L6Q21_01770 [Sandaracinobacter sp. RS1-74]|uniref:hypothetical protein n=1 Tax=Sandaracinobacteroides sayramensis TaxID=2913411 RepID=UPI001EDC77F2|nr:hypothetical protein [Sandaracinobacteroides sayramensis]MCG2839708.1 hypothetical protein [Sandaracinobacteroides sayramensis]
MINPILALLALSTMVGAQPVPAKAPEGAAGAGDAQLGFDLRILLSQKAAEDLARRGEGIIVSANYYGTPMVAARRHANAAGMIDLGEETRTLSKPPGSVRLTGDPVDRKKIGWLQEPPMVNVNIFTARRSSPDNLISCDFIDGPVARVAGRTTTLTCSLIGENREVSLYPR